MNKKMSKSIRILLSCSVMLTTSIVWAKNESDSFLLNGLFSGFRENIKIYLIQYSSYDTVSSAVICDGKFSFRGKVPNGAEYYFLKIEDTNSRLKSEEFLLENSNIVLTGNFESWPKIKLTGCISNDELIIAKRIWQGSTIETKKENIIKFINEKNNSIYIPDLIRRMTMLFSEDEIEILYNSLGKKSKESYFGKLLEEDIKLMNIRKKIIKVKKLPDLSFTNMDGQSINLNSILLRNRLTLVDFWASWCKPCRNEMHKIKEVYEEFVSSGFDVIGLSIGDKEHAWKEAVIQDAMPFRHGFDNNKQFAKLFDISAIPAYMLLDNKGNIISFYADDSKIGSFGPIIHGLGLRNTIDSIINGRNKNLKDCGDELNKSIVKQKIRALKIGDKVPDLDLGEIVNHPFLKKAKVSDFKGSLLILDFWSTWCSLCIDLFPKMERLQKKFGDKITILPVGFDAGEKGDILRFLEANRGTSNALNLPCLIQRSTDSLLMQLFPFSGMPHEIWIDTNGKVIGITNHLAVTESNIQRIINGEQISFSVKKKRRGHLLENESFLLKDSLTFGSAFTGFIDSFATVDPGGFVYKNDSSAISYHGINRSIFSFYRFLYKDSIPQLSNKKILIEPEGSLAYKDRSDMKGVDNWTYEQFQRTSLFAYEIVMPSVYTLSDLNRFMIQDFDRYFKVRSHVEKRSIKSWAVVRNQNNTMKSSKDVNLDGTDKSGRYLEFNDVPTELFIEKLNSIVDTKLPIVNRLSDRKISAILPIKRTYSIKEIKFILKEFGLDLKEVQENMDVLVLSSFEPYHLNNNVKFVNNRTNK